MTQAGPASAEHPLVGQTIANKFKIIRVLGEGGMGVVYLGEQMLGSTARKVAVKTLHTHLSQDKNVKARFDREVETVAGLEHPNTIQIIDYGSMPDGTLYIVMEFVQGQSVADILEKEGPMPPPRVENILRQVVGSLNEAHGKGIIHRDLKPDNVVLAERAGQKDWVEVLDFGIAKRSSEHDPNEAKLTQQGMVLGTPPYMSPEQFTGQPIDSRSDIYALGVMAYEMLSGKLPWEANTAWEWASKHMTEAPAPLFERQPLGTHIPQSMRDAISRALAKDKEQRFATVNAFFEAFTSGHAQPAPVMGGPQAGVAITPGAGGTSVINAQQHQQPNTGPHMSHMPNQRVQTEMGTPAVAPMSMGPNMGPNMSGGAANPYGAPPSPAQPQMVTASSAGDQKKSPVLIIVLGGLAAVLLIGAGVAAAVGGSGHKTSTAGSIDLTSPPAPAPAPAPAPENTVATAVTSAAPLTAPEAAPKPATGPKPTPAKPAPPPAPKPDPQSCQDARKARSMKGMNANTLSILEKKCKDDGGNL